MRGVEGIVFFIRFAVGLLFGDFASAGQHVILAKGQEGVDTLGEFLHGEGVFSLNQIFDIIKISGDGAL